MGGCQSSRSGNGYEAVTAGSPPKDSPPNHKTKQYNNNKTRELESMVRVGSKVLKNVPNQSKSGDTHLEPSRASTYDHVHNVVLTNFEGSDVLKRKAGVVGLRNLGNTCFMNSSLQCLSNTIPLTDYCLGYNYRKEINYENFLGTRGELVTAYTALMKQMWLGHRKSIEPSFFKDRLCEFAPQFEGGRQHDAQEVLAFLLDGIHEDLNRVKKRPYIQDKDGDGTNDEGEATLAWQNYLQRNRSIVVDLFQGQLRNTMTCRNQHKNGGKGCGHKNIKFEPFMYLSLPISRDCCTLDDCLDLYCTEEHLTGDNQWYCPKCKEHVNATKKFDIWMLPPILIVHLKRFDGKGRKIETPIYYPLQDWDWSRVVKSNTGARPLFDLYAVSNHGGDLGGGHYTAMVKNRFDEAWYEMNDSTTRKIDPETELQSNPKAYCLFYNRVEQHTEDGRKRSDPKVRRQSTDRPELWPHMQLTTEFKDFQRSTIARDVPPISREDIPATIKEY